jgi:hypothetical protein
MTCIKYLLFIILIVGLVLTIYGSCNIPNELPGYTGIYSGSAESIAAQTQQHQDDLRNYQIRSKEFLITMIGLGFFLIGLIFCIYCNYRHEYYESRVASVPNNRSALNFRKQIELKNKTNIVEKVNISKTETATAPKIDEVRPLELSETSINRSNIKPPLDSNSPPATLVPPKNTIPQPNKQVQFNIPQTYQNLMVPRPLYYKHLPVNYQEYYNKNGYPRPIPYQMVR